MFSRLQKKYLVFGAIYLLVLLSRCLLIWSPPTGFFYNIDELEMTLSSVDRFLGLPPTSLQWPGSILQLLFLPVLVLDFIFRGGAAHTVGGQIAGLASYVSGVYANPVHAVALMRYTVAVFASATPLLAYAIAHEIVKSKSAAFLCAASVTFAPILLEQSAMAMAEGISISFAFAAVFLIVRFKMRFVSLAGFLFAGALAARVTSASLAPLPVLLLALELNRSLRSRLRAVLVFVASVAFGFVFWCPYVWTDPIRFVKAIAGHLHGGAGLKVPVFFATWTEGMGVALSLVALIAVVGAIMAAVRSPRLRAWAVPALLAFCTVALPLMSAPDVFPRYFLPMLPSLLIMIAVTTNLVWNAPNPRRALIVVFAIAAAGTLGEATVRERSLRGPDGLAQALQASGVLRGEMGLYLPQEALYLYRIAVPGAVYGRMKERAGNQIRESSGLLKFLKLRGIPEEAGKVLLTDFNEEEQALNARLAAASATTVAAGQPLFFYFDPVTINGIVEERLTPADYTLEEAMAQVEASNAAVILLKKPCTTLGEPIWHGEQGWYLYQHKSRAVGM